MNDFAGKREIAMAHARANRAALSAAAEVVIERDKLGDRVTFALDAKINVLKKALTKLQAMGTFGR